MASVRREKGYKLPLNHRIRHGLPDSVNKTGLQKLAESLLAAETITLTDRNRLAGERKVVKAPDHTGQSRATTNVRAGRLAALRKKAVAKAGMLTATVQAGLLLTIKAGLERGLKGLEPVKAGLNALKDVRTGKNVRKRTITPHPSKRELRFANAAKVVQNQRYNRVVRPKTTKNHSAQAADRPRGVMLPHLTADLQQAEADIRPERTMSALKGVVHAATTNANGSHAEAWQKADLRKSHPADCLRKRILSASTNTWLMRAFAVAAKLIS